MIFLIFCASISWFGVTLLTPRCRINPRFFSSASTANGSSMEPSSAPPRRLPHLHTAIDNDINSGHVRTVIGGQKQSDVRHLFRPAEATQQRLCRRQTIPANTPTKRIYKGPALVANFCI
jgi:hypothetical protein